MGEIQRGQTAGAIQSATNLVARVVPAAIVVTAALVLAGCSSRVAEVQSVAAPVPTATATPATPTSTPEPELPPVESDEGEPIEADVAQTAAFGLFEICSLYEPARLSELLGEFWALDDGVEREDTCLWSTPVAARPRVIVSITLNPTTDSDNAGTTVVSETGEGVRMTVQGNEMIVNVVSDDVDPTFAELNAEEAERRIADDVFQRLTGRERPSQ